MSPLPLSNLPSSLLTPGSVKQHSCDFTPLLPSPCGFPAPPCPALSTSPGCAASPPTAAQSTPTLPLSGRQHLKDLVLNPWALPSLSLQLLPAPGPPRALLQISFSGQELQQSSFFAVALQKHGGKLPQRAGSPKQAVDAGAAPCVWEKPVCFSCLAFRSAEERGSRPPSDGLSPAHVAPELS